MDSKKATLNFKYLPAIIIFAGILLRIWVYIDNRCLWTDETNIALNIYEKNFAALAGELSYQQYAPPLFLWACKLFTTILGYGEKALRLYPLLSGIGCLFLLNQILKNTVRQRATWYPLLILATSIFFLRYSTELKQYMPDAFISTTLIWLAIKHDILKENPTKLIIVWITAGSLAIWGSMPSVFILASVSMYYFVTATVNKKHKRAGLVIIISTVWLFQFLLYYYGVLKQQINSDYLSSYHKNYFIHAFPSNKAEWIHNKDLIKNILSNCFGNATLPMIINSILVLIGTITLFIKRNHKAFLFITPILLMLTAAALNQYSLIPRLTLFIMPILIIIAGLGLNQILPNRSIYLQLPIAILCLISIGLTQPLKVFSTPIEEEQITEGLDCIVNRGLQSKQVYIYAGAVNSFKYYTSVHPEKYRWDQIKYAHILLAETNHVALADKAALLYTIPFDSYDTKKEFEKYNTVTDSCISTGCEVYFFN